MNRISSGIYSNEGNIPDHHSDNEESIPINSEFSSTIMIPTHSKISWWKSMMKLPYEQSERTAGLEKNHFDKDKIRRQMREEGFWKKSYQSECDE
ncbi:hypothetical protein HDV02_003388 [Globomyces sp. JEL0801]|nr:hypothetical protein HDV02_003388 [Globomyces sp. JEL0801]